MVNQYSINGTVYERPITDSFIRNSIVDGNILDGNEFVLQLTPGSSISGDHNIIRTFENPEVSGALPVPGVNFKESGQPPAMPLLQVGNNETNCVINHVRIF